MTEIVVSVAMEEELRPFLIHPEHPVTEVELPWGHAWQTTIRGKKVHLIQTGIGLVNAASVLTLAVERFRPDVVLSSGSAGGLADGLYIGDVVVGTNYAFSGADATAFDYALGQIPQLPETFPGDAKLAELALHSHPEAQRVLTGKIVSGDAFVDARLADAVRANFPAALVADMESAALAQVSFRAGVPFLSVRAISDLCSPRAVTDHEISLEQAAERAATVTRSVIERS